ncbi:uncharacterized protein LOC132698418 isoform X2 [Cylas formicarius]|uniref:uncharacterized protein LOC132698418 isoform X2 n=1 Tax=Cylas formicarius TaxID=197179 RepID=UPI002958A528|nr:uncharacterized protein LOC132698418 isoform X2 [Cylas formicarius]
MDDRCNAQILERVQSDRVTVTKPEEDRRRRTIIVEKKNGTFGFTIQSYGIHYKKEKEIEMITYVDYVDYDGPAYRAGMREGDVILSINGTDMEKADHKTLVNYIKNCESRMRMVVLFEDCVRKVELHMRYIKLQNVLESKMEELERLCIRERQLLEGKWKTHSLPARKKATQANASGPPTPQGYYTYCRPTVSTEDVAKVAQQKLHLTPPLVFAYQYFDTSYRYMLQPSTSSSGEYLLTFEPQKHREKRDPGFIVKTPCDESAKPISRSKTNTDKVKKGHGPCHSYGGHLCSPCVTANPSNGDNTSLEAYDLASPCCDPHCVPARRRPRVQKDPHGRKRESKTEETQTEPQQQTARSRPHSQVGSGAQSYSAPRRNFHIGAGLVSQCSLHSCTSSEISNAVPYTVTGESSNNSYTTSLSTDTLYWDGSCESTSRQTNPKSGSGKHDKYSYQQYTHEPAYCQYNPMKPKSWDNLTTKAFGGYGFGYGYLDTSGSTKCPKNHGSKMSHKSQTTQYVRIDKQAPQYTPHTQRRYFQPTKSTESLLAVPKYSNEALSDSSISCECLEASSPLPDTSEARFFQSPRQSVISPTDPNFGYYSARRSSKNDNQTKGNNACTTTSEATRL